jgi:hypothetical protein
MCQNLHWSHLAFFKHWLHANIIKPNILWNCGSICSSTDPKYLREKDRHYIAFHVWEIRILSNHTLCRLPVIQCCTQRNSVNNMWWRPFSVVKLILVRLNSALLAFRRPAPYHRPTPRSLTTILGVQSLRIVHRTRESLDRLVLVQLELSIFFAVTLLAKELITNIGLGLKRVSKCYS